VHDKPGGVGHGLRHADGRSPSVAADVPDPEVFRSEVRSVLEEELPSGWSGLGAVPPGEVPAFVARWREVLYRRRLLAISWPARFGGRGLGLAHEVVLAEELTRVGVPLGGPNDVFGIQMIGNTLLALGRADQKEEFLPRILSGEYRFCQGYSEPDAGSDLANLACRAVRDGDEWVVDGQKIWTSAAHLANWIFLLVRTDPDAPKHRGLTFLLLPMNQPGVEVRPIRMLSGLAEFNEVFFTGARTGAGRVVGEVGGGWSVAMTLLGFERGEAAATQPLRYRMELDRLIELAKARGWTSDPVVRERLARCHARVEIMRALGQRSLARHLTGSSPGPESSIFKLYWSEYHQDLTALALELLGPEAMVIEGRAPLSVFGPDDRGAPHSSASWVLTYLHSRAGTIYAGTSEIQRNILGEKVLGLPREPRVDGGPWSGRPGSEADEHRAGPSGDPPSAMNPRAPERGLGAVADG
jgi:alkylation response protein AidB-like acyl-CoA dehydrogenase